GFAARPRADRPPRGRRGRGGSSARDLDRANRVDSAKLNPRSVDVDPVDLQDRCFQAAGRIVGGAGPVGGRLRPDAEIVPPALDDASALVFRDVFVGGAVQTGRNANLAVVGGFDNNAVVADRIGRDDSLEAG